MVERGVSMMRRLRCKTRKPRQKKYGPTLTPSTAQNKGWLSNQMTRRIMAGPEYIRKAEEKTDAASGYQPLQGCNIPAVVSGFVNGGFSNEGSMGEAEIVEQNAKGPLANSSLPDVLMAVELRSPSSFG